MSPSCSSLYLIPLHSSRARRQGTAPITLVPSGPDTSLPSSGLVSSICRGSPPPELLVTSMAAPGRGPRARSRLAWGRAGRAPAEGPHPPTAGKVGGRGLGAPRGDERERAGAGGRVRAGRFLGCFLLAAGAHAGANGLATAARTAGDRGAQGGSGPRGVGAAPGTAGAGVSRPRAGALCGACVRVRPLVCAAGGGRAGCRGDCGRLARAIGPRGVMCPPSDVNGGNSGFGLPGAGGVRDGPGPGRGLGGGRRPTGAAASGEGARVGRASTVPRAAPRNVGSVQGDVTRTAPPRVHR